MLTELSAQFSGVTGADFSAVICVREWVFGFVAYRDHTQVLLGEESHWFALPSWLTAVLFCALALAEWFILRRLFHEPLRSMTTGTITPACSANT